jgi:hypothetical protein
VMGYAVEDPSILTVPFANTDADVTITDNKQLDIFISFSFSSTRVKFFLQNQFSTYFSL